MNSGVKERTKTGHKTAIAFQGGGALGAYALGVLKYIYEERPEFRPAWVSGVSIGAFTAAIVASNPDDPVSKLREFWDELALPDWPLVPNWIVKNAALFGNPAFYVPRADLFRYPTWTYLYETWPIRDTLSRYVDLERLNHGGAIGLVVTATNVSTGEVEEFSNRDRTLTLDHILASGSLPPSFPSVEIGSRSYWDGGLFDNTPLSALFKQIDDAEAEQTRIIVVNLFPSRGRRPANMLEVSDRMIELQFANKTGNDVKLARTINKLVAIIEGLQGVGPGQKSPLFDAEKFQDLKKYKVFNNIISITNEWPEDASSGRDFSSASILRRVESGFDDAETALNARPTESESQLRAAVRR